MQAGQSGGVGQAPATPATMVTMQPPAWQYQQHANKRACPYPSSNMAKQMRQPAAVAPIIAPSTSRFDDEFGDFAASDLDRILALTDSAMKTSSAPFAAPINHQPLPDLPPNAVHHYAGGPAASYAHPPSPAIPPPPMSRPAAQMSAPPPYRPHLPAPYPAQLPQRPPQPRTAPITTSIRPNNNLFSAPIRAPPPTPSVSSSAMQSTAPLSTANVSAPGFVATGHPSVPSAGSATATPEEEVKRLRSSLISCSHDRAQLRLQQRKLQAQFADKDGAIDMLRVKLRGLESEVNRMRVEASQRVAHDSEAQRAQHDRLKSQIESLNQERDAMERELVEIGQSNTNLTKTLHAERQNVLSLKRQLAVVVETSNRTPPKSLSQKVPPSIESSQQQLSARVTTPPNSGAPGEPGRGNRRQESPTHCLSLGTASIAADSPVRVGAHTTTTVMSRVISSALEDGLFDLLRSSGGEASVAGETTENALGMVFNESLPLFCALPILRRVISSGSKSAVRPALNLLHTLVSSSADCRLALLGPLTLSPAPTHLERLPIWHDELNLKTSINPYWRKSSTSLVVTSATDAIANQLHSSLSLHDRAATSAVEDFASSGGIVECPELLQSLFALVTQAASDADVHESLMILLNLLNEATSAQLQRFDYLVQSPALPSLLDPTKEISCRTLTLRLLSFLFRSEANLSCLSTLHESGETLLHFIHLCFTWQADVDSDEVYELRLAAVDTMSMAVAKYGEDGIRAVLDRPPVVGKAEEEYQVLPRLALMITALLDQPNAMLRTRRLPLVVKGLHLIESLLAFVNVGYQMSGYRFVFLSMLSRLIQYGDPIAECAASVRATLISGGCLDLLQDDQLITSQVF